jgi:isoquinoline 1-oxidoreductase beta subunit
VRQVVEIDRGVAVVAEHTWAALQGREALEVTWDEGEHAELSSAGVRQYLLDRAGPKEEQSDPNILEADYEIPFLSHVPMEPMNCLADVRADGCVVWAPTQDPADAKLRTLSLTHLHSDTIQVYIPLIGGGFGRRLQVDYVEEAVQVSQAAGAPVQVFWTREDDVRHDFYHPASLHRLSVDLQNPRLPRMRSWTYERIPTGPWRSATELAPAFARESFLDEMAAALGRDSYELRMELFTASNARAVLETVASEAGWGTPLPEGRARGMAYYATWGVTPTAHVVEVSVVGGMVRVHRVVCAIDCGIVINPDMVEAQMEGGILFGLTAALKGEITLENGRVQQGNFHDYPLWRIDEMPEVEVHIVDSEREPQGVGEMAVPPILPALLNAVYAATGKRIRHIPIRPEDLRDD